ncbi:MAG TPA: alpha/beta hydrolase-fold protein [Solirubrobacteraceae bacterium]
MRGLAGRMSVLLVALAVLVTGLDGAYRYWESYYQYRGFAPVRLIKGAAPGRRLWVHFYSKALHRNYDYLIYLPPHYDPAHHRYPVYYLLHGSPGRPQVFTSIAGMGTRMDNLVRRHRMAPMILVFPDGRINGSINSDSEWANTSAGRYESYVIDVVHNVDQRFATEAKRSARVIAGFSAGAYGAANIALHHPNVFGNLQAWSGYYRQTRTGVFANATAQQLAANSPAQYVSGLRGPLSANPLRAFLFTGRDDNASPQVAPMALALARAGARVTYALYKGGHDWQLWHAQVNRMLIMASRDTTHPLRRGPGSARYLTPGVVPLPNGIGRRPHAALEPAPPARRGSGSHPVLHLSGSRQARRPRHARRARLLAGAQRPQAPQRRPAPARLQLAALHIQHRHRPGDVRLGILLAGLLLALGSAALINLGFLFQHRGLVRTGRNGLLGSLRAAVRSPAWLGGQVLGWTGFAAQVLSVAIAPLALVQAFAAGGLALSVPLAARIFGHPISRGQRMAVFIMAAALATLPFGYSAAHDRLQADTLGVTLGVLAALALAGLAIRRSGASRAIAAGVFYGAADAAIKAVSVNLGPHGWQALLSVWTGLVALGTFGGFLAFQSALAADSAISAISLMNGFAALAAMICGLLAFGESLGTDPVAIAVHVVAIGVVLASVPKLAAAQTEMSQPASTSGRPASAPGRPAEYGSPG